ncbi:MAG: type VI secretion system baseplate subunit TssF [Pseudomonadota bacterium]|nr:type VI secretion system baseplate subunit TssF [Pseudomonadota bacterium]
MAFNKYFEDELSFLRELGEEFARDYPNLAPYLAEPGNDPDVERLLEGFAFLTGRVRQKLDDELPELTHSLMALLWPHYLRPLPSVATVAFDPVRHVFTGPKLIPRGSEVDSTPIDGTTCRFRTCYDVTLLPLEVADADVTNTGNSSELTLGFSVFSGVQALRGHLGALRLHLHADRHIGQTLYLWFRRYLTGIRIQTADGSSYHLPVEQLKAQGFAEDQTLLPYPKTSFAGYRYLQEYFHFPEKFLYFDLHGLDELNARFEEGFSVHFHFSRPLDPKLRIRAQQFRLHCTPVVNLFAHSADPIRVDQRHMEYRVRPQGRSSRHFEIFSIDRVEGWIRGSGRRRRYPAFESFDHLVTSKGLREEIYYRQRVRSSLADDGLEHHLSFVNASDQLTEPATEVISLDLTCSNRQLAGKLGVGDICVPTAGSPPYARFSNISPVTPSVSPPMDDGLHWRLISNIGLNYLSLNDIRALRVIVTTYDFHAFVNRPAERAAQQRMEGLIAIESEPFDWLYEGLPVRGVKSRLTMHEKRFGSEGEMYLLATVLNEFFSLYANVNSFHALEVVGQEHGEVYQWPPKIGRRPLL